MRLSLGFDRWLVVVLALVLAGMLVAGCGVKVKPKRSLTAPPIVYCHDAIGHVKGNIPWILGGKCCCTPTEERFARYKQEGTVPDTMTYDEFLRLFKDKGIITDLDVDHRASNCAESDYGPHVVFGGRCMVTPTPGTRTFEEVTSGQRAAQK